MIHSQQGVQISQYMLDKYQINPAYAGMDYSLSATAALRSQYSALPGNPKSQWIGAHMPYYKWNGAFGIQINNDQVGLFKQSSFHASYSYIVDSSIGLFSAALKVGAVNGRLAGDEIVTPEGEYNGTIINHNDPTLSERFQNGTRPDLGVGLFFRANFMEAGLSASRLIPTKYNLDNTALNQQWEMTFFAQSTVINSESWKIVPSLLIKTDLNEVQTDLNVLIKYNGNVFGGVGVRGYSSNSFDAISMMAGLRLNEHYTLSYNFDMGISDLRFVHEGGHEIMLNYNLNKLIGVGSDPKIIYNPRHL